jgi:hypothetical protein
MRKGGAQLAASTRYMLWATSPSLPHVVFTPPSVFTTSAFMHPLSELTTQLYTQTISTFNILFMLLIPIIPMTNNKYYKRSIT